MWEKLTSTLVGFAGHLLGGLKLAASFIFARVMAALGLAFVSYNAVLPSIKAFIQTKAAALPDVIFQLMGAMGVDVFMVLIISAYVAKIGMRVFLVGVTQLQQMISNAGG